MESDCGGSGCPDGFWGDDAYLSPSVRHGAEQLPVWQVIAGPVRPVRIVRRVRGFVVAASRGVLHELLAVYDVVEVGLLGALGLPLLVQPLDVLKVLDEAVLD